MKKIDVIVVGAGTSGLISALSLLNSGYRVLLLEANENVGGLSKVVKKGRFEFDYSLNNIYVNNNINDAYKLSNVFKECGILEKIDFTSLPDSFKVITKYKNFTLHNGIDNFINDVEKYVPGSSESVRIFFDLALECKEAMDYIYNNLDKIDYDYVKKEYNNFVRVANYSNSQVLDIIEMPIEAQEILNVFWMYFGSTETEISFVEYAMFIYNFIENRGQIPTHNGYDITLTLANDFLERGGEIKLNSRVVKLIIDDDKVNGVKLENGETYYSDNIIINSSLDNVYGKLINPDEVPRDALKNLNQRKVGGRPFVVHLGLNRSAKELGIKYYNYFLYSSLDSDVSYAHMKELSSFSVIATCKNVVNEEASPLGTSVLTLSTLFFDDCFAFDIDHDNYNDEINKLASEMIDKFEKYTGIRIRGYIEEIDIVSPIDIISMNDCLYGASYGYRLVGHDNLLPRLLNRNNENYIDGLYVCNGFEGDIFGYNSSCISGLMAANDMKKDSAGDYYD